MPQNAFKMSLMSAKVPKKIKTFAQSSKASSSRSFAKRTKAAPKALEAIAFAFLAPFAPAPCARSARGGAAVLPFSPYMRGMNRDVVWQLRLGRARLCTAVCAAQHRKRNHNHHARRHRHLSGKP